MSPDRNEYDVSVELLRVTEVKTPQHTWGGLVLGTFRFSKTDGNVLCRWKSFHKIVVRVYTRYQKYITKETLSKIYWD